MDKERTTKEKKIKYFHEVIREEQELLKLSYEESVRQREERKNRKRKIIKWQKYLTQKK